MPAGLGRLRSAAPSSSIDVGEITGIGGPGRPAAPRGHGRRYQYLQVFTDSLVLRLRLQGRRATGVSIRRHGQEATLFAEREIILAAGLLPESFDPALLPAGVTRGRVADQPSGCDDASKPSGNGWSETNPGERPIAMSRTSVLFLPERVIL